MKCGNDALENAIKLCMSNAIFILIRIFRQSIKRSLASDVFDLKILKVLMPIYYESDTFLVNFVIVYALISIIIQTHMLQIINLFVYFFFLCILRIILHSVK